jgi:hypothetical protein
VLIGGGMISSFPRPPLFIVFDLGALDGIFRVVVFIAVRLALLGMGGGCARLLGQRDKHDRTTSIGSAHHG